MRLPAAWAMMRDPVAESPVSDTIATRGSSVSAAPTSPPGPVTTLNTPGGNPTSRAIRASSIAVRGVFDAGLRMTVLPAASAGPTFHAAMR